MIAALLLLAAQDDWTHWRGPRAAGSVETGTYPSRWDAPAWKVKLPGKGGSTPLVVGERIYLTAPDGGEDAVLAFDLAGKLAWTSKLGPFSPAKHKALGSSCSALILRTLPATPAALPGPAGSWRWSSTARCAGR